MKTTAKILPGMLSILALIIACTTATALADQNRGRGGNDGGGADAEHLFDIDLPMTPTADAPAGSSARLSFEVENEDGTSAAELEIKTRRLPAATYTVIATLKSDGSAVTLGTFPVGNDGEGEIEFGHEGASFPASVNPLDLASVTINGPNGVVLFTVNLTDVTNATTMNISTTVQATAGAGVPNATGTVSVNGFVSRGRAKGSLQFSGHGLPANQTVILTVNGIAVKTLHTSKTGDLNVKIDPKGKTGTILPGITLAGITSVAVVDRNGNILLQASL